jgi:hypothetical protein
MSLNRFEASLSSHGLLSHSHGKIPTPATSQGPASSPSQAKSTVINECRKGPASTTSQAASSMIQRLGRAQPQYPLPFTSIQNQNQNANTQSAQFISRPRLVEVVFNEYLVLPVAASVRMCQSTTTRQLDMNVSSSRSEQYRKGNCHPSSKP